jgi:ribonuclease-3
LFRSVFNLKFKQYSASESKIYNAVKLITGFYPKNISLYQMAFRHSSVSVKIKKKSNNSNERLEYLGDAILGAVIAEFLFNTFPFKDEGFLSQLRSRIVSRSQLDKLAVKLGLNELIEFDLKGLPYLSIYGDAFEAFIGAIYIDQGFDKTKKFIVERIMKFHIDINDIENTDSDYKSKLINFCQRNKRQINFSLINEIGKGNKKEFIVQVEINNKKYGLSRNFSKRRAEQHAAELTIKQLTKNGLITFD